MGEESVDVYLAWLDEAGTLQPLVAEGDFRWEMSRLSVRLSWWRKQSSHFSLPSEEALEQFRQKRYQPSAQVLLVSSTGIATYYSKQEGLGNVPDTE